MTTETVQCGIVTFGDDGEPIEVRWTEERPGTWFDDELTWVSEQTTPSVIVAGSFVAGLFSRN